MVEQLSQVKQGKAVSNLKNKQKDLKVNSKTHRQPVEGSQDKSNVFFYVFLLKGMQQRENWLIPIVNCSNTKVMK